MDSIHWKRAAQVIIGHGCLSDQFFVLQSCCSIYKVGCMDFAPVNTVYNNFFILFAEQFLAPTRTPGTIEPWKSAMQNGARLPDRQLLNLLENWVCFCCHVILTL